MIKTISLCAAILLLGIIAFTTMSSMDFRPYTGLVGFERAAAFFLLAIAMTLAFPRRLWFVVAGITAVATGLEFAQQLVPDRHAELADIAQKLGGAGLGVAFGYLANRFRGVQ